jgi:hypothetical protein
MTQTDIAIEPRASELTDEAWLDLLARLNHQSVHKHFDAYGDIDWDSDEFLLDPTDPRWELTEDEPLATTDWYRDLPPETRARLGCELTASRMKAGLQFESVLKRGLLEFAFRLPNGSPEFRYAYHEVIEEAQHALMFQEFVNRSGYDAKGLNVIDRIGARAIIGFARWFPELFFVFVLGGEDPIDHVQRRNLRRGGNHPLKERIMRIHVTEEARHLSFARHYLKRAIPGLNPVRRIALAVGAPVVLAVMADMMLTAPRQLIKRYDIPKSVIAEAYIDNPGHRSATIDSLAKVRNLCEEVGLLGRPFGTLWRRLHLVEP